MHATTHYSKLAPKSYQAMLALEDSTSLDNTLKELIKMRVSQINGCLSRTAPLPPAWQESPLFNEREKAALQWAEALTLCADSIVSEEDYQAVRAHFSEEEVAQLTFVISTTNAWNRLNIAFASDPGNADTLMGLGKAGLA